MLPVSTKKKEELEELGDFGLWYDGKPYAIMRKPQFFPHRKEERVSRQFGTSHPNHPYIKVRTFFVMMCLDKNILFLKL